MSLQDSFKKMAELMTTRTQMQIDFLKHILLLASGLFGILIALRGGSSITPAQNTVFAVAISVLALGILCGAIALYSHVYLARSLYVQYKEAVEEQLRQRAEHAAPVVVNPPRIFSVFEIAAYVSLCLSVLGLCVYAVLISIY